MTERLYYTDPYCTDFSATVTERLMVGDRPAVVLDRSCFYPESGGQPADRGALNGVAVVDAQERSQDKAIVHVLAGGLEATTVQGHVDWQRRFDQMQQHTGQHILSQAFERLFGAETVGFHLGDEVVSIDLAMAALSPDQAAQAEEDANAIIYQDRPLSCRFVAPAELTALPLRKPPAVTGDIRIVEVTGYDWSPCGGTHVSRAGEVGIIALRKWERRGSVIRLDFLCGHRALADYRWKNAAVNHLAAALSVRDRDLAASFDRTLAEAADNRRRLHLAAERLLEYEAADLLAASPGARHTVVRSWTDRPVDEVRRLAQRITQGSHALALLGAAAEGRAHLVFARSADEGLDMSALLKRVLPLVQGKGGGSPSLAQGSGTDPGRLQDALDAALREAEAACLS